MGIESGMLKLLLYASRVEFPTHMGIESCLLLSLEIDNDVEFPTHMGIERIAALVRSGLPSS